MDRPFDPFLREAERELEEFLRRGRSSGRTGSGRADSGGRPGPEPTGSLQQARQAHRRLLSRYHPDRFARVPDKQRLATRIAQILKASFRRIRDFRSEAD